MEIRFPMARQRRIEEYLLFSGRYGAGFFMPRTHGPHAKYAFSRLDSVKSDNGIPPEFEPPEQTPVHIVNQCMSLPAFKQRFELMTAGPVDRTQLPGALRIGRFNRTKHDTAWQ